MLKKVMILCSILWSPFAYSQNADKLYNDSCASCHNDKIDTIPTILGQSLAYLKTSLYNFQDTLREDEIMFQIMEFYTPEQIESLALYISEKNPCDNPLLTTTLNGNIKEGKIFASQYCESCHKTAVDHNSPIPSLASQRTVYLIESIKKFQSEYRNSNHEMIYRSSLLDEQIVLNVAAYFNSLNQCQKK